MLNINESLAESVNRLCGYESDEMEYVTADELEKEWNVTRAIITAIQHQYKGEKKSWKNHIFMKSG